MKSNTEENETIGAIYPPFLTEKERNLCCVKCLIDCCGNVRPVYSNVPLIQNPDKSPKNCCQYNPNFSFLRWLGLFCCGCCSCPVDDKGLCKCSGILVTYSKSFAYCSKSNTQQKKVKTQMTKIKMPYVCIYPNSEMDDNSTGIEYESSKENEDSEETKPKELYSETVHEDSKETKAKEVFRKRKSDNSKKPRVDTDIESGKINNESEKKVNEKSISEDSYDNDCKDEQIKIYFTKSSKVSYESEKSGSIKTYL